jgi:hypothetical protein
MTKRNLGGRPAGPQHRKRIDLPDGDQLVPFYTAFSEDTGLNPKSLQRIRRQLPTTVIAGVVYVRPVAKLSPSPISNAGGGDE